MRKALIVAAFLFMLSCANTIALAGYNDPQQYTTGKGPHGDYTAATNKCKECHAVHGAEGSYRLTRTDSRSDTCEYCHGLGSPGAGTEVILDESGHGPSQANGPVIAPNDTDPPFTASLDDWGCLSCHSVHDTDTIQLDSFSTTRLLRADPNPGKDYLYYEPVIGESTQTVTEWCSACHNANYGLHTDPKTVRVGSETTTVYGHDVSAQGMTTTPEGWAQVDPDDGINQGPTCRQCHQAEGFPHSSGDAPSMLESDTTTDTLDSVCVVCHNVAELP